MSPSNCCCKCPVYRVPRHALPSPTGPELAQADPHRRDPQAPCSLCPGWVWLGRSTGQRPEGGRRCHPLPASSLQGDLGPSDCQPQSSRVRSLHTWPSLLYSCTPTDPVDLGVPRLPVVIGFSTRTPPPGTPKFRPQDETVPFTNCFCVNSSSLYVISFLPGC